MAFRGDSRRYRTGERAGGSRWGGLQGRTGERENVSIDLRAWALHTRVGATQQARQVAFFGGQVVRGIHSLNLARSLSIA